MLRSDVDMIKGLAEAACTLSSVTNSDRVSSMLLKRIEDIVEPPKLKAQITDECSSRADSSDGASACSGADADPLFTLRQMAVQPEMTIQQLNDYATKYGLSLALLIR